VKPRILAALAALAVAVGATAALSSVSSGAASSPRQSDQQRAERATAQRTQQFLQAFERRDLPALSSMLDPGVTLVHPISFSGSQDPDPDGRFVGKEQVLGYFGQAYELMARIDFVDDRVSVVGGGRTSFVQANGNFTTADGRPYRNVYLFRIDWRGGRIVSGEEYYNPVTFSETFGKPLG